MGGMEVKKENRLKEKRKWRIVQGDKRGILKNMERKEDCRIRESE